MKTLKKNMKIYLKKYEKLLFINNYVEYHRYRRMTAVTYVRLGGRIIAAVMSGWLRPSAVGTALRYSRHVRNG